MNEKSIIQADEAHPANSWLDPYMPDGDLAVYHAPPSRTEFISLAVLRGMLFRQRWLIVSVLVLAVIGGLIVTLLSTPMYQADAKVAIKPVDRFVVEGQDVNKGNSAGQIFDFLGTQVEIIKSRSMAETVVVDRNLAARSDLLGKDVDERRPAQMTDAQWLQAKKELAATVLTENVVAELQGGNWVLTIGFRSENPALAAEIANAYADAFVSSGTRSSLKNNQYALEYLKTQVDETRQRLAGAEQVANAYARQSGIISDPASVPADGGEAATLTATNVSSINARVAAARAARIEAEQRWKAIQRLPAAELPEVQSSAAIQSLIADRTNKFSQIVELRQRYNDDFPQIQNLLAQIKVIDNQIERSGADVKAGARSQFLIAQVQEQALEAELRSLTGARLVEQDQQVELSVLDREAQALRDQLKSLLDRYNQVNSAANVDPGTISKIDSALVPDDPFEPNPVRNLGLAIALGLACAIGLAVLRETFDDRVRSLEEVESKIGIPLLGQTPNLETRDLEAQEANRFSSLMEAYSSIRAAIDFSLPRNRNVIQVTSTLPSEGKSTSAVILAELFASLGRKTLLIDADLRRPSVHALLNIERAKVGLVEVLLGHVELESALVQGVHENLSILPVGETPPSPVEILASAELRKFIEHCRQEYDLVIFDSCPVMGLADAPTLAAVVDGTVFVLEANRLSFGQARAATRRLMSSGGKIIGAILTKYRALEAGQTYDYQYGYYEYGRDR